MVRRIFATTKSGRSVLDITKILNAEGIANPTGRLWSKISVHNILRNEAYTGTLVWGTRRRTRPSPCGRSRHSPPTFP